MNSKIIIKVGTFIESMDNIAHSSHSFWLFYLIYGIFWHALPPPIYAPFVLLAGNIPDFDGLYWKIKGKVFDTGFQHHMYFWSHWPISYLPVVGIFLISLIADWYPSIFLIPVVGIYSHLLSDSASCGDGMMWGKIPWKKHQFAPFYNFFSSKTDGYHGKFWTARYRLVYSP